ncbi:MAG: fibronectin type III domain-containing protein [Firmicutes bacterium]|nr:fibronectin type III domain-containing protein [Bacillota bacterium]
MKKAISVLLILALALTMCFGTAGTAAAASQSDINSVYEKTGDYIYKTVKTPVIGTIGGCWAMYGLAKADYDMPDSYVTAYKKSVVDALEKGYRGVKGQLHDRKYTDYSRVIVAYSELGLDPTDVGGYNLVEKLADYDKVIWQGINGPIWALRALDSGDYDIPKVSGVANKTTRQKLINGILDAQLADGGWALSGSKSDPDLTGMALTALAPYKSQKKVKAAIDEAVDWLSKAQLADGSYVTYGDPTAESCAQVICGLTAVGINPNTNSKFKKNGKSVLDGLMTFYDAKTGGFRHVNEASGGYQPVVDQMATEQAFYALAHYKTSVPDKAVISTAKKADSTSLKVTWKKAGVGSGYQVVIATNSKFTKNAEKFTVKGRSSTNKTIKELKKGKTYYVKVRAYKTVNGTKLYGAYSVSKKVKL